MAVSPRSAGRWLNAGALAAALLGLMLTAAGLIPTRTIEAIGGRFGRRHNVTAERVVRMRVACGLWAAAALAVGFGAGIAMRPRARQCLQTLAAEWHGPPLRRRAAAAWCRVRQPGRCHVLALALVLLAGLGVRLRYLDIPMDYDEAYSFVNWAARSMFEVWADYNSLNDHLLNSALMRVCYQLLGQRDWAVRLPVFIAGVLLIPAVYRRGRRIGGPDLGLLAASLVAVCPILIGYSTNARGYMLMALFTLLCADRLLGAVDGGRLLDWLVAGLWAGLGFWALPSMLYPFVGLTGWLIGITRRPSASRRPVLVRRAALFVILAGAMALAGYTPAVIYRGALAPRINTLTQPMDLAAWPGQFARALEAAVGSWSWHRVPWGLTLGLAAAGVVWLMRADRPDPPSTGIAPAVAIGQMGAIALATLVMVAVHRLAPPVRVLLFLAPDGLLLVAAGLLGLLRRGAGVPARWAAPTLATVLVAVGLLDARAQPYPFGDPDRGWTFAAEPVVAWLAAHARPGDRVLAPLPCDLPVHYYQFKYRLHVPVNDRLQTGERVLLMNPAGADLRGTLRKLRADHLLRFDESRTRFEAWQPIGRFGPMELWTARVADGVEPRRVSTPEREMSPRHPAMQRPILRPPPGRAACGWQSARRPKAGVT